MYLFNFELIEPASWNGFNINALAVDQAYLNITSATSRLSQLYSLSSNCERCPFTFSANITANSSKLIIVDATYDVIWRIYSSSQRDTIKHVTDNRSVVCEIIPTSYAEYGIYDLVINNENCDFSVRKHPVNIYLSLLLIIILGIFGIYVSKNISKHIGEEDDQNSDSKANSRVKAIDTFRGICLCLMIIVNDGGGKYWFLNHSIWDGITLADVLFPWFLWIMGVCVALSHKSQVKKKVKRMHVIKDICRRSCVLFILGLVLNTLGIGPVLLSNVRIMGVLQRFAISYAVVASVMNIFSYRQFINLKLPSFINDVMILWPQWFIYFSIITVHYVITFHLPVPGCPTGYIGAGGIQDNSEYSDCTGGASLFIDKLVLGEKHLYSGFYPSDIVYRFTTRFDPENILGCFTAIFQVFLGLQAGSTLSHRKNSTDKILHWIIWSIICLLSGFYLHFTSVPMNKNLWSVSFVFVTSGLAFLLFALCYLFVDCYKQWSGTPFIYPGMNSIIIYVGHVLCYNLFPWHWRIEVMNTHFILLLETVWGLALWLLISYLLYKQRVFISV